MDAITFCIGLGSEFMPITIIIVIVNVIVIVIVIAIVIVIIYPTEGSV